MAERKSIVAGRMPDPRRYVYKVRDGDAKIIKQIWDHRYITRQQLVEMFFDSESMADKVLSSMVKEGWIQMEQEVERIPARGRHAGSRTTSSPELDPYFTGRPRIYSVAERGLAVLRDHGEIAGHITYAKGGSRFARHHVGVVEIWRYFQDACDRHQNAGRAHSLEWLGPRRTFQLVDPMRERAIERTGKDVAPDAFFTYCVGTGATQDEGHFFVEADFGTEYESAFRDKLDAYEAWTREVDRQGLPTWEFLPPMPLFPRVLIVTVNTRRQEQVAGYLARLGSQKVRYLVSTFSLLAQSKDPIGAPIWWEQYAYGTDRKGQHVSLLDIITGR